MPDWIRRIWDILVGEPWKETDRKYGPGANQYRKAVLPICLVVTLTLIVIDYFGFYSTFEQVAWFRFSLEYYELSYWAWWSLVRAAAYIIIPLVAMKFLLPMPISELGISFRNGLAHFRVYAVLYLLLLPALVAVSYLPSFTETYPFYSRAGAGWDHLIYWELLYALQFLALEFFFRGFMLHTLKYSLGGLALPVMVIPYVMIHFSKPLPECLGAMVAGLVLGGLSLKTGRIWGGVILHIAVAVTMDILALWQKGGWGMLG
jgi:membrane protease YdiL (CAAX protease family)